MEYRDEIPTPPSNWVTLSEDDESARAAERKTAVMRLQNRLQQSFAKKLKPGQGVWEWSYETDARDESWPPLQRATVHVPVAQQSFTGPWKRGQREAQLEACQLLQTFLDSLERPEDDGSRTPHAEPAGKSRFSCVQARCWPAKICVERYSSSQLGQTV
eukprot:g12627.t1